MDSEPGHDDESVARRAIALLDLTELGDHATDDDVVSLCTRAVTPHGRVAAVCVWPRHVALAMQSLGGNGVRIATVVNFPTGDESLPRVVNQTEQALADGADEIDLVLPYHAFLQGNTAHVTLVLESVRGAVPKDGHLLKVILETGELGGISTVHTAAHVAVEHGADFIKTSTGKSPVSATLDATAVMLDVIHEASWPVGLKPSGGIRTLADARAYIDQADGVMGAGWAAPDTFRFGASGLLDALLAALEGDGEVRSEADY
jgi:deoxyribose-phosphate aldolase